MTIQLRPKMRQASVWSSVTKLLSGLWGDQEAKSLTVCVEQ